MLDFTKNASGEPASETDGGLDAVADVVANGSSDAVSNTETWLGLSPQDVVTLVTALAFHQPRMPVTDSRYLTSTNLLRIVVRDVFEIRRSRPIGFDDMIAAFDLDAIEARCWRAPIEASDAKALKIYLYSLPRYQKEKYLVQFAETVDKHNETTLPLLLTLVRMKAFERSHVSAEDRRHMRTMVRHWQNGEEEYLDGLHKLMTNVEYAE